jgi:hypothetical protein
MRVRADQIETNFTFAFCNMIAWQPIRQTDFEDALAQLVMLSEK